MTALTSQCPCAQKMRLPPRLPGESPPANNEIVVCVYCERVGRASTTEPYARTMTNGELRALPPAEKTRINNLRDDANRRFPKRRRRPLPRAAATP